MSNAFRDAGLAALERAKVLDEENAALRRELARYEDPTKRALVDERTRLAQDVAELRAELERTRNALHNSTVPVQPPAVSTQPAGSGAQNMLAFALALAAILVMQLCGHR